MSLNLYSGSLQNFYTRNFKTPIQVVAEENNWNYTLAIDTNIPSKIEASIAIRDFRKNLETTMESPASWKESDKRYLCLQLTEDCLASLISYLKCHFLKISIPSHYSKIAELPDFETTDDYMGSFVSALEAHIIVPMPDTKYTVLENPIGLEVILTTHAELRQALNKIKSDILTINKDLNEYLSAGPPEAPAEFQNKIETKPSRFNGLFKKMENSDIESRAKYAFAVYSAILSFAEEHCLPICLDR